MTSLSAGRPALQPIPAPGSGPRTRPEQGSGCRECGGPRRGAGPHRTGRGLAGRGVPHPLPALRPAVRARAPGINTAAGTAPAAGAPGRRSSGLAGFRGSCGGFGLGRWLTCHCPSIRTKGWGRAWQTLRRPGPHGSLPLARSRSRVSLRPGLHPPSSNASSSLASSFPAGASQPLLSLPRVWLRRDQGQPVLGQQGSSHAAGGGGRGRAAGGCAPRGPGADSRCAPPLAAACGRESALASSLAPTGPRAFWPRAARAALPTRAPLGPVLGPQGPRLASPAAAAGTLNSSDLVRAGRQRARGHPG